MAKAQGAKAISRNFPGTWNRKRPKAKREEDKFTFTDHRNKE
jgi:hypothetical protein